MRVKITHLVSCLEQVKVDLTEGDMTSALARRDGITPEHIAAIDKTLELLHNERVFDDNDVILAFE